MSLLRRMGKAGKHRQILIQLLRLQYPDEEQLQQEIERLTAAQPLVAEESTGNTSHTQAEFLIDFRPKRPTPPIRTLLEEWHSQGELTPNLQTIVAEHDFTLTVEEQAYIETNPIDFLMGIRPPKPRAIPRRKTAKDDPGRVIKDEIIDRLMLHPRMGSYQMWKPGYEHEILHLAREAIAEVMDAYLTEKKLTLTRAERQRLFEQITATQFGYDLLEPLLADETVSEIRVLGPKHVSVVRNGKFETLTDQFDDYDHLYRIIYRIAALQDKRVDDSSPLINIRMPDGSSVSIIHPTIANNGPTMVIHKWNRKPLSLEDLVRFGTLTPDAVTFLQACVQGQCNLIVTGQPNSGRTTLLNMLGNFIPRSHFIVTIESPEEVQLMQEHVLSLHTIPPNIEGRGEITAQDLLQHVELMRPEHVLVGEIDGSEAHNLLTYPAPWLTTLAARDPLDAVYSLTSMYLMGDPNRPVSAVRARIAEAVHVIVHMERLRDGARKVTHVSEVQLTDEGLSTQDIFRYERNTDGEQPGRLQIVGRPSVRLFDQLGFGAGLEAHKAVETMFGE